MVETGVAAAVVQRGRATQFADGCVDLLPVVKAHGVALLAHFGRPLLRYGLRPQSVQAKHHLGGFPGGFL